MLHGYNNFDLVLSDMKATNKKQIFKNLARAISKSTGLDEKEMITNLTAQDKIESTSIGYGVTMPQVKISSLTQPFIAFARIQNCHEFDTIDGQPIDMICCALTPETITGQSLQRLASMSRMFGNKELCTRLRDAQDHDHIQQIMMEMTSMRRAA